MCDACAPAAFGFSSSGCQRCDCHYQGSQNEFCQPETGQVHTSIVYCCTTLHPCFSVSATRTSPRSGGGATSASPATGTSPTAGSASATATRTPAIPRFCKLSNINTLPLLNYSCRLESALTAVTTHSGPSARSARLDTTAPRSSGTTRSPAGPASAPPSARAATPTQRLAT